MSIARIIDQSSPQTLTHPRYDMVADISAVTKAEVLSAIRSRYGEASKKDKSRMLDEFVAIAGCHRKQAVGEKGGEIMYLKGGAPPLYIGNVTQL